MHFTLLDYLILIFMALCLVQALWRGFLQELLNCFVWIAAVLIAFCGAPFLAEKASTWIASPSDRFKLAFIALFIAVWVLGIVLKWGVRLLQSQSEKTASGRLFAGLLSLVRSFIVVSLLLTVWSVCFNKNFSQDTRMLEYFMPLVQSEIRQLEAQEQAYLKALPSSALQAPSPESGEGIVK